jgi:hypothetical protein
MVLASVVPPGAPYNKEKFSMANAFPIDSPNWDSAVDNYKFEEEVQVTANIAIVPASSLLFDIKEYNLQTGAISDYGFAIYPMTK